MYMPPKKKPKLKKAKPTPKLSQVQTVTVNVGAQEKPKRKRKPRAKKAASVAPSLGLVAPSQEQGFARYIYPTQTQQDNSLITDQLKAYLKQIHGGKPADNLQIAAQTPEQPPAQPPAMPALPAPAPEEIKLAPTRKPGISILSSKEFPQITVDNSPVSDEEDYEDAVSVAGSERDISEDDLSSRMRKKKLIIREHDNLGAAAEAPPVMQSPEEQTLDDKMSPGKPRAPRRSKAQMEADKAMDEQKKEEKRIAREIKAAAAEAAKEEKKKEKKIKLGSIREE